MAVFPMSGLIKNDRIVRLPIEVSVVSSTERSVFPSPLPRMLVVISRFRRVIASSTMFPVGILLAMPEMWGRDDCWVSWA